MRKNCNVLILGQTGVGKSALLNYLFGEDVADVGDGKPVTKEGIYQYRPFNYERLSITIYDSWGLEPNKADKWKRLVEDELKKHNTKSIKEWFHTVIYCVDAQKSRFESFEDTEVIRPLVADGYLPVFALTKSDLADSAAKQGIHDEIGKKYPNCSRIEVSSISATLISGKTTKQDGKKEMLQQICLNFRENLIRKAFSHYRERCNNAFPDIFISIMRYFENRAGLFTHYGDDFKNDIIEYASRTVRSYMQGAWEDLRDNINEANTFQHDLSTSLDQKIALYIPILDIPMPSFNDWDNDFIDYIKSTLRNILWGPLNIIFRKDRMRKIVADFCSEMAKIIKNHTDKYINNNERRYVMEEK